HETLSSEPIRLTVRPVGEPVVVTDHVYVLGIEPPEVRRLKDTQPPARPGLMDVAVATALQETPVPPDASICVDCAPATPPRRRRVSNSSRRLVIGVLLCGACSGD